LGGVYFHSASGGVASELTVIGGWVPEVIEVLSVVWRASGVVV
jgi:hypothetical protein